MKKRFLLLFTDYYPYEKWEPYLQPEMEFLYLAFEHIFIFSNYQGNKNVAYTLPQNAEAFYLSPQITFIQKVYGLRLVFSKIFRDEIFRIRTHYQIGISISIIKIALQSLLTAMQYKRLIEQFLMQRNLNCKNTIAYAYWTDDRALAAAMLSREGKIISISRAHGWDVYFERHATPYLPFRKFLSQHLSNIFFVSENGRKYFLDKAGSDAEKKLRLSRLGIEAQKGNPPDNEPSFIIVSCARLIPLKRPHLVADILRHVHGLPVKWIHFGAGKIEDDFLKYVRDRLGGKENIVFDFRGDVSHGDLMKFYAEQHVDLFMLTSEYEGMPFVIIEALSFGIPVMATDAGGIAEVINSENGFLLEKNFQSLEAADLLQQFAGLSRNEKSRYRSNALATWDRMFNAEKNFPEFISTILNLTIMKTP